MADPVNSDQQQRLAADLFNETWTLMQRDDRGRDDDDRMLNGAHASRYLWGEVGTPLNRARGEWQLSRVYCLLARAEPALYHARRCLDQCTGHGISGFDLAYAHEAMARAHALAGDREAAAGSRRAAEQQLAAIEDAGDRELLVADLATVPV
ncbi:MAG: MerR family transcriptional regulator, thiopeptide resistance regulator [Pseudonocardiales bacterium]|nr:MerR family transcriptional regulator, thiopeptide resistance regulator [Pseudonocardiales bacterium]